MSGYWLLFLSFDLLLTSVESTSFFDGCTDYLHNCISSRTLLPGGSLHSGFVSNTIEHVNKHLKKTVVESTENCLTAVAQKCFHWKQLTQLCWNNTNDFMFTQYNVCVKTREKCTWHKYCLFCEQNWVSKLCWWKESFSLSYMLLDCIF